MPLSVLLLNGVLLFCYTSLEKEDSVLDAKVNSNLKHGFGCGMFDHLFIDTSRGFLLQCV
jgi:hypothetical protein